MYACHIYVCMCVYTVWLTVHHVPSSPHTCYSSLTKSCLPRLSLHLHTAALLTDAMSVSMYSGCECVIFLWVIIANYLALDYMNPWPDASWQCCWNAPAFHTETAHNHGNNRCALSRHTRALSRQQIRPKHPYLLLLLLLFWKVVYVSIYLGCTTIVLVCLVVVVVISILLLLFARVRCARSFHFVFVVPSFFLLQRAMNSRPIHVSFFYVFFVE